jgi:hypothetical protein
MKHPEKGEDNARNENHMNNLVSTESINVFQILHWIIMIFGIAEVELAKVEG